MNYTLKQGEDLLVEVGIVDATNQPVDISTATEILVEFIQNKIAFKAKYSLNTKTGYGDLTIDGLSTVVIKTTRTESAQLQPGYVNVIVLVEMTDVDLTVKRTEYQYPNFIKVETGYMKDVEI